VAGAAVRRITQRLFVQILGIASLLLAVAVASGAAKAAVVFSEDFESGAPGWQIDNGVWQIGVPTSGPGAAHQGTSAAATVLAGNYPRNVSSRLISPTIDLPASQEMKSSGSGSGTGSATTM